MVPLLVIGSLLGSVVAAVAIGAERPYPGVALRGPELVREIVERVDDGRPVSLQELAGELGVDVYDLYGASRELARQRGSDPLLDRAHARYAAARRAAAPRR